MMGVWSWSIIEMVSRSSIIDAPWTGEGKSGVKVGGVNTKGVHRANTPPNGGVLDVACARRGYLAISFGKVLLFEFVLLHRAPLRMYLFAEIFFQPSRAMTDVCQETVPIHGDAV